MLSFWFGDSCQSLKSWKKKCPKYFSIRLRPDMDVLTVVKAWGVGVVELLLVYIRVNYEDVCVGICAVAHLCAAHECLLNYLFSWHRHMVLQLVCLGARWRNARAWLDYCWCVYMGDSLQTMPIFCYFSHWAGSVDATVCNALRALLSRLKVWQGKHHRVDEMVDFPKREKGRWIAGPGLLFSFFFLNATINCRTFSPMHRW